MRIDTEALKSRIDLRHLASQYTTLKGHDDTREWSGPCPKCGGDDRFHVTKTGFFCSHCHGKRELNHDAIEFFEWLFGLNFRTACERLARGNLPTLPGESKPMPRPTPPPSLLTPPDPEWQVRARAFVERSQRLLWQPEGKPGLDYLLGRGFSEDVIKAAGLGYNPKDINDDPQKWGVTDKDNIWLPGPGIVIPWRDRDLYWRINIRLREPRTVGGKEFRYIGPAGFGNGLYNSEELRAGRPAIIVEGELDALTIQQHAGDIITPVATGSIGGSRCDKWIARLAACSTVLVAFDADKAGDEAARFWLNMLPNARRWRPFWGDANQMALGGVDIYSWIEAGLPTMPEQRWVPREIYRHFADLPAECWPFDLYKPDGTRVWFNSPAELLAATVPDDSQ